ncbi:hypothetical protein [[Clostridium] fimetarium]|uniref:Uncharacterized protein n=1 Tax=[Clostridium] fimetarium TaxID=99656 RepID=A0A1I0QWD8_9FIRM|nr:hypothetical protein [[Clostridium] fimetarium]SEW31813.1 hypothetical protein SAMN05421659_109186 [[Clostridium] fimetarium]
MKIYDTDTQELLKILLDLQESTAPIKLSIGYVKDGIVNKGLVLIDAPPVVTTTLIEAGYSLDITEGIGVHINKYK